VNLQGNSIHDIRLAMGGVAHKPWRFTEAENYLKGKTASAANFKKAAELVMANAKGFGHNNFKLQLAPNTIIEALKTATGKS
jgi:xanthine dehydrogenase YagS FAD-binding subunit